MFSKFAKFQSSFFQRFSNLFFGDMPPVRNKARGKCLVYLVVSVFFLAVCVILFFLTLYRIIHIKKLK